MGLLRVFILLIMWNLSGCSAPAQLLNVSATSLNPTVAGMMSGKIPCTEPFKFIISSDSRRESLVLYTHCESDRLNVILLSPVGDVRAKLLASKEDVKLTEAKEDLSRMHPEDLLFIALFPELHKSEKTIALPAVKSEGGCDYSFRLDGVEVKLTLPDCNIQE